MKCRLHVWTCAYRDGAAAFRPQVKHAAPNELVRKVVDEAKAVVAEPLAALQVRSGRLWPHCGLRRSNMIAVAMHALQPLLHCGLIRFPSRCSYIAATPKATYKMTYKWLT